MGAQCDQDYLARLYFFDCYGGRRFIQVCVRSLRCRQRFRHRSFRGRPDRRHQAISGDAAPVSLTPDDTELAKANDAAVELLARISPAIVTPDIVSRHWQESVPPVVRQTRIQKVKRKQAKNEPMTSKPPLALDPQACQLEEFDAFRWAFNLPTGCHL